MQRKKRKKKREPKADTHAIGHYHAIGQCDNEMCMSVLIINSFIFMFIFLLVY